MNEQGVRGDGMGVEKGKTEGRVAEQYRGSTSKEQKVVMNPEPRAS